MQLFTNDLKSWEHGNFEYCCGNGAARLRDRVQPGDCYAKEFRMIPDPNAKLSSLLWGDN